MKPHRITFANDPDLGFHRVTKEQGTRIHAAWLREYGHLQAGEPWRDLSSKTDAEIFIMYGYTAEGERNG